VDLLRYFGSASNYAKADGGGCENDGLFCSDDAAFADVPHQLMKHELFKAAAVKACEGLLETDECKKEIRRLGHGRSQSEYQRKALLATAKSRGYED